VGFQDAAEFDFRGRICPHPKRRPSRQAPPVLAAE